MTTALAWEEIEQGKQFRGLPHRDLRRPVFVIHESVTRSLAATRRVLRKRGLSCHYGISEDARVVQWAPRHQRCAHAGPTLNARSIGVELTNPYYPRHALRARDTWPDVIQARWAHEGAYVVPTLAQLEALYRLALSLDELDVVPLRFVGVEPSPIAPGAMRLPKKRHRVDADDIGIVAHSAVGHADGAFPVAYMLARSLGHEPLGARLLTMRLAQQAVAHVDIAPPSRA